MIRVKWSEELLPRPDKMLDWSLSKSLSKRLSRKLSVAKDYIWQSHWWWPPQTMGNKGLERVIKYDWSGLKGLIFLAQWPRTRGLSPLPPRFGNARIRVFDIWWQPLKPLVDGLDRIMNLDDTWTQSTAKSKRDLCTLGAGFHGQICGAVFRPRPFINPHIGITQQVF